MGKDMAPMTRAHLTPSLLTIGPPKKQTAENGMISDRTENITGEKGAGSLPSASMLYLIATLISRYLFSLSRLPSDDFPWYRTYAVFDVWGVARPPPPRPNSCQPQILDAVK